MWDCLNCGCKAIIVVRCPMCGTERNMARSTVEGGYSDQYEPADPADDQEPDETVPVVEDNAEHDPDRGNGPDPAVAEVVLAEEVPPAPASRPNIRSWARENGFEVSDKGPISAQVAEAYAAANDAG